MDPALSLAVLALGVGLGSAAAAWVTRRPESMTRVFQLSMKNEHVMTFEETPSPEDVEALRQVWQMISETPQEPLAT